MNKNFERFSIIDPKMSPFGQSKVEIFKLFIVKLFIGHPVCYSCHQKCVTDSHVQAIFRSLNYFVFYLECTERITQEHYSSLYSHFPPQILYLHKDVLANIVIFPCTTTKRILHTCVHKGSLSHRYFIGKGFNLHQTNFLISSEYFLIIPENWRINIKNPKK